MVVSTPSAPPSSVGPGRSRILGITVAVTAALAAGALAVDRLYSGTVRAEAESRLQARLVGHASALQMSLARRAALLDGLTAWMQERADAPSDAFDRVAESLHRVDPGVRALQRVVGGLIVDSYPLEGNEGVLGLDVLHHPDPDVASALARALDTGSMTVNGPVDLVQGGVGIILRRSTGQPGDRDAPAAALVVDLATLLDEAGIPPLLTTLDVGLVSDHGELVFGDSIPSGADPLHVSVPHPEGSWTLVAAPVGGWHTSVAADLRSERLVLATFLVLAAALTWLVVGRDLRLAAAVTERTAELTAANERLREAAAQLAAREKLLQAALTAGRVATWSWDMRTDRIWRWGSDTSVDGGGPDLPSDIPSLVARVHPEDRQRVADALEQTRRTGELGIEYRVDVGDGTYGWMRTEGRCSERDTQGPTHVVGAVVDITRIKELEEAVIHRGRLELIGRLAGGVVHDLSNALAVVRAELEMALEDESSFPLRSAATESLAASQYASLLIGQLLTFARKDRVTPTSFAWDGMCAEVTTFLSRLLGRTIDLELALDAEGATVHMDRAQAMQILTNLAVNARDAMSGAGTLTVATRLEPDGSRVAPEARAAPAVVLEVHDTGSGIPPEARPYVFEAFFTTKGEGRGTGLGLSTTQRIVRESGGDITFRTSSEGTTFVVVIPVVASPVGYALSEAL
jgi:signal transduction histidine kinase